MTEISEAAKARAKELVWFNADDRCRVAAFVQQVSDAAKALHSFHERYGKEHALAPFILPEPVDPLTNVFREAYGHADPVSIDKMRKALAKRGYTITETTNVR